MNIELQYVRINIIITLIVCTSVLTTATMIVSRIPMLIPFAKKNYDIYILLGSTEYYISASIVMQQTNELQLNEWQLNQDIERSA